jgi:predicted esterase
VDLIFDERHILTFGWSSSGHVLYSIATSDSPVRGSIVAVSRFLPNGFPNLDAVRGKGFFLYHSPEDRICPFREARLAESTLKEHGAR